MLVLLSPAKKQNFDQDLKTTDATQPAMKKQAAMLVDELKTLKTSQIAKLMGVSDNIAKLNFERYQAFETGKYNRSNSLQTIFALQGDAYQALDVSTLSDKALSFLQDHLVILSGLYGCLRPLDLIQPYRLEMKTPLKNPKGKDLYAFWGDQLAKHIEKQLANHTHKIVINVASGEYVKAVKQAKPSFKIIDIVFKEKKGKDYKVIGIHAKKARGLMTRYIASKQLKNPDKLKSFTEAGYYFSEIDSDETKFVFLRD